MHRHKTNMKRQENYLRFILLNSPVFEYFSDLSKKCFLEFIHFTTYIYTKCSIYACLYNLNECAYKYDNASS